MPRLEVPPLARWQVAGQSPANGAASAFAEPATRHVTAYAVEDETVRMLVSRACTIVEARARVVTAMAAGTGLRLDVTVNGVNTTFAAYTDADGAGTQRSTAVALQLSVGDRVGVALIPTAGAPLNVFQWALDLSSP